jgi:hypothetical protein
MSGPCRTFHYRTKKRAACHDKSTGLYAVQAHPGGYREGQVWGMSRRPGLDPSNGRERSTATVLRSQLLAPVLSNACAAPDPILHWVHCIGGLARTALSPHALLTKSLAAPLSLH